MRKYQRYEPSEPEVWLSTTDGRRIRLTVLDESFGGLGTRCDDPVELLINQVVTVTGESGAFPGKIASIKHCKDGSTLVSIKWRQLDAPDLSPTR